MATRTRDEYDEVDMIRPEAWQTQATAALQSLLEPNQDVMALALFGSSSKPDGECDFWSDLDCLLVVKDSNSRDSGVFQSHIKMFEP